MALPMIKWLNENIKFSKEITNLERDFSDGHLFSEFLSQIVEHHYLIQLNPGKSRQDKLGNFKLLQKSFDEMNIKMDNLIADQIIKEETGVALRVLFQMKHAFQKKAKETLSKTDKNDNKASTGFSPEQKTMMKEKQEQFIENYYRSMSASGPYHQMPIASKTVKLEAKLQLFRDIMEENEAKAKRDIEIQNERLNKIMQDRRQHQIDILRKNKEYLITLDEEGMKKWNEAEDIKNTRLRKEHEFEERMTKIMKDKVLEEKKMEKEEFKEGLAFFADNLLRMGIETKNNNISDQAKKVEKTSSFSTAAFMNKLKEKKAHYDLAIREKEKRLRKIQLDQEKSQKEIEARKKEEQLLEKFINASIQQVQACEQKWREENIKKHRAEERLKYAETLTKKREEELILFNKKQEEESKKVSIDERQHEMRLRNIVKMERNLLKKIEKRKKNNEKCKRYLLQIVEMVDMCYNHQMENKSIQIDPRFWRNITNLFVEGKISLVKKNFRNIEEPENKVISPETQRRIDEIAKSELSDYIEGINDWKLIPEIPKESGTEFDENIMPNIPIKNFLLTKVIFNIIDSKFPSQTLPERPILPEYMPLKLIVLGNPFAGKKTLANFIKSKYSIEFINVTELIKEAIEMNNPVPVDDPKSKNKKTGKQTKNDEIQKPENPELKALGAEMKEYMNQGKEIPTGLLTKAILIKIKNAFPIKTEQELAEEVKNAKIAKENELKNEVTKAEDPKKKGSKPPPPKPKKEEIKETQVSNKDPNTNSEQPKVPPKLFYYTKGWIISGFPINYTEVRELEFSLSGYIPQNELLNQTAEDKKNESLQILCKPLDTATRLKYKKPGVDAAIYLEVSKEECLRRARNRKIDPQTGNIYHMEDNPPPMDIKGLNERLIPLQEPENTETALIERISRFEEETPQIEEWFKYLGIDEILMPCLQRINGIGKLPEIQTKIDEILTRILELRHYEFEKLLEKYFPKPPETIETGSSIQLKSNEIKSEELKSDPKNLRKTPQNPNLVSINSEETANKMLTLDTNYIGPIIHNDDTESQNKYEINLGEKASRDLAEVWDLTFTSYMNDTKEVFVNVKDQMKYIADKITDIQDDFMILLERDEERTMLFAKFYDSYNKFLSEKTHYFEYKKTLEEILNKLDELNELLWDVLQKKKNDAIQKRKDIIETKYFENEIDFLVTNLHKLMQFELERHGRIIHLIQSYYGALLGKEVLPPPEPIILELTEKPLPPNEDPEDPYSFPKLDRLYSLALRILHGDDSHIRKGLHLNTSKSIAKPLSPIIGNNMQTKIFEEERNQIIAIEKKNMKLRLFTIHQVGINRIHQIRFMGRALYDKLDDWIVYSIKNENDAIYSAMKKIRQKIESKEAISMSSKISFENVMLTHKPLQYNIMPAIIPTALEKPEPNRFTISQLLNFIWDVKFLTNEDDTIDSKIFTQYFSKKINSSKEFFPQDWHNKDGKVFNKMINNLTKITTTSTTNINKSSISWKKFAVYLCLISSPIPTTDELKAYEEALYAGKDDKYIIMDDFLKVNAWYDQYEQGIMEKKNETYKFDRIKVLKMILFHIFSYRDSMNIDELIECLNIPNANIEESRRLTYNFVLFE